MKNLFLAVWISDDNAYRAAALQTENGTKEYFEKLRKDNRLEEKDYLRGSLMWALQTSGQHRGTIEYSIAPALVDDLEAVDGFPRAKANRVAYKDNLAVKTLRKNLEKVVNPAKPVEA